MGLREVLDENTPQDKVVIVRSIVPTRELGHLPGELEEKIAPYEEPYRAICSELFPYAKSYDNLKKNGYVSFEPTSFLRGKTFNNSIVIFDECQNANSIELYTVLSRVGFNTRVIVAGDFRQADLNKGNDKSAFKDWLPMLQSIRSMGDVQFLPQDIVRSGFVRELIMAKEEFGL
jgi:phosphate starvation-inducible PhoH-like protein